MTTIDKAAVGCIVGTALACIGALTRSPKILLAAFIVEAVSVTVLTTANPGRANSQKTIEQTLEDRL
jgi:hypothetical protein